nr:EOG090X09NT [Macrothrix elegans]
MWAVLEQRILSCSFSAIRGSSCGTYPISSSIYLRHVTKVAATKHIDLLELEDENKKILNSETVIKTQLLTNKLVPEVPEQPKNVGDPEVLTFSRLVKHYASLSKFRLTGLVVCSAVTGYAMAPLPTDLATLAFCLVGTSLTSASANTINQFFEIPFDSQMARTSNRVLVRGLLTPQHAFSFALASGITGLVILNYGVNGLCASLGALTLGLYTLVYTPMKRTSIANTWVGSVVGALPPLMGYAGCTGYLDAGALVIGGLLYAWQFPHFNALSWNLRNDYTKAGYKMMCAINPDLCRRTTLRYTASIIGLCSIAPAIGLTTWTFALDSLPVNMYFLMLAWRFYRHSDSSSSRKLFRMSLAHLPIVMILMLLHKKREGEEDYVLKALHSLPTAFIRS